MSAAHSFAEFDRLAREGDLVPIVREVAGDTETPISAFLKLPSTGHAFLLESAHSAETWGRYSFLGDQPLAHVSIRGGRCDIEEASARTSVDFETTPFAPLRALLKRRRMARTPGLPRFAGGLVGYLGWGAVRWFEPRVPQRHGPDPDFADGEWMLAGRLFVFDNLAKTMKLVACADLAGQDARTAFTAAQAQLDQMQEQLRAPLNSDTPFELGPWRDQWGRPAFEQAVARVKDYIAAGDCFQSVLSRRLSAQFAGSRFGVYRKLRSISPTPYQFFLRFGDRALAGASPELLVRVEGGRATLRPIAGTRPRGATPAEDQALAAELCADPKERAEHVMLLDLARNDLGRVSQGGSVAVEEREIVERYSNVMHLVSQVSGALKPGLDAFDVIAATFPAGTVSGAPKVRAMEIIDELEPIARGPYAGAAGYIGWDGGCDLAISIRTVAFAGDEIRLHAGAGIVHDSDPAREFQETEHKLSSARRAVGTPP